MSTTFITTNALEDGGGIDFAALRAERRARVRSEMERQGIDALILGRRGNVKYLLGHRVLWRADVTNFSPLCIYVRATDQLYATNQTWSDGVPPEIPLDHITGMTRDPENVIAFLRGIDGLRDATAVAVDGMSNSYAGAVAAVAPHAEFVDGRRAMWAARRVKLPAEIHCIRTAIAIAEGALTAAAETAQAGVAEQDVKASFHRAMTRIGATLPAIEGIFCATPREPTASQNGAAASPATPPLRQRVSDRPLQSGDLVALNGGVLYAGYQGAVARTVACHGPSATPRATQHDLFDRWNAAMEAITTVCRPGARPSDIRAAWQRSGEPLPPVPLAFGVGIGVEQPMVTGIPGPQDLDEETLQAGMVLTLQGYVWERGVGGYLGSETVLVTDDQPERLTRMPHPLADRP